jgi:AcrR family transcriptional regulator
VNAHSKRQARRAERPRRLSPLGVLSRGVVDSENLQAGGAVSQKDVETRLRVLTAASRLFAANGFKKVTVREICRAASANVAAVNYHFGDKLGLYREVLAAAIETMRATTDAARQEGDGKNAEHKLRAYIRVFLDRVIGDTGDAWIHQLMTQEMADPTPALDLVIEQVLQPRISYLSELVAEMLNRPVDDAQVRWCVISIQAQCHAVMRNPVSRKVTPEVAADPVVLEHVATHIAEFSLGGIRSARKRSA